MSSIPPEPRRLHPATMIVRWLKIVPQLLFAGIAAGVAARDSGLERLFLLGMVLLVASGVFAFLYWWRFSYTIFAGEIVIEKGLVQRQRRVIPFDRVQDIAIEQKLLARLLGIAKVRIETGGAGRDEGDLDSVALDDAHALRDHIRRGARAAAAEADADAPAEPVEEPVLFEMSFGRLLYAGLFGFSLVFLAAISAVLQQLDQFDLIEWDDFFNEKQAEAAVGMATLQTGLGIIALVLLLGLVAGVVRTVLRDYGFRLTRSEAGLRRRRGLVTLSEVVIPIRRTQVALIEGGLVSRALGWYRLSFQTLGADRKEGGVQVAAPFARMEEILPILAEAGFPPPPPRETLKGRPRRALILHVAPWLALIPIAFAAGWLLDPAIALGALVFALLGLLAMLRWRTYGHGHDAQALYVAGGLMTRRVRILPYEKTQAIRVSRGPLQRPLALATLLVDTAGATAMHNVEMPNLDADEADAEARRLYRAFLEARARIKAGHA